MIHFFQSLLDYLTPLLLHYRYFSTWGYYEKLFQTYFSFGGFVIGLGFVFLVYLAGVGDDRKIGFIKTIAVVALINSCSVLWKIVESTVSHQNVPSAVLSDFLATENVISGLVMTVVITSCYWNEHGAAFCFGLVTYGINLFMFPVFQLRLSVYDILYFVVRAVVAALLCLIISDRYHFYTGYIWYAAYYLVSKAAYVFVTKYVDARHYAFSFKQAMGYASAYKPDLIFTGAVLLIAVLYENVVLNVSSASTSTGA